MLTYCKARLSGNERSSHRSGSLRVRSRHMGYQAGPHHRKSEVALCCVLHVHDGRVPVPIVDFGLLPTHHGGKKAARRGLGFHRHGHRVWHRERLLHDLSMHSSSLLLGWLEGRNGWILWSRHTTIWLRPRCNRNLPGPGHSEHAIAHVGQAQHVTEEEAPDHVYVLRRLRHHSCQLSPTLGLRAVL